MTALQSVTLEASDVAAAEAFYADFGVGKYVDVRAPAGPSSGFRGYTLSLVVAQPKNVDAFLDAAVAGGGAVVKPAKKSLWGYGGVVQAPDGALWKVATSSKKDRGPAVREFDALVLLLGVADVKASKEFYVARGLEVAKSFGRKYAEFAGPSSQIKLALYGRRALAKDAGVSEEGSGSHRIVLGGNAGPVTDPDGFVWEDART